MNLDSQMCLRAFFLSKDLTKLEQTYYWSSVSTMFINSYDQAWQMWDAKRWSKQMWSGWASRRAGPTTVTFGFYILNYLNL